MSTSAGPVHLLSNIGAETLNVILLREREIEAAELSRTRSSLSCTDNVHDHTRGYQGYRPVSTQIEHEGESAASAWFGEEDYVYASDESTSLLSDYDKT